MFVHPTLFWCAGSWNLTTKQLAKLHKVQCSMLRKMISPKQASNESRADFMHRSASLIKNLMTRHGVERWDLFYHRLHFAWAGHVSRIVQYDPSRLTYKVLDYKCLEWIHKIAEQFSGRQLHCRKLRIWRWEQPLFKYDPCWRKTAQDKQAWFNALNDMVLWRSAHR